MNAPTDIRDVVVIGAGIVGGAIARGLAGTGLSVTLVEGRDDVGDGTSKANTALLHTGFDATPGTLESRLVARGYHLLGEYAEQTGIPVERTGALLVAWTDEESRHAAQPQGQGRAQRLRRLRDRHADEVYRRVPELGPGALAGLTVPGEAIICTWTTNLALATEAVHRGAELRRGAVVTDVVRARTDGPTTRLSSLPAAKSAAAGSSTPRVSARTTSTPSSATDRFTVTPRRGELLVFDKLTRPMVPCIVLAVPSSRGKGVLVSPTIYGNVMVGPTSENLDRPQRHRHIRGGLRVPARQGPRADADTVRRGGHRRLRRVCARRSITTTTSSTWTRPAVRPGRRHPFDRTDRGDGRRRTRAGTAGRHGLDLTPRDELPPAPRMPNIGEAFTRPYQDAERIAADPEYGRIVCFCERVTAGEIRDAFASPIPPRDLDGLRRRTRVMNGRCQGFYCGAHTNELLHRGVAMTAHDSRGRHRRRRPVGLTAAAPCPADRRRGAGGRTRGRNRRNPQAQRHLGYGIRDLKRFITGPAYARRLTDTARDAGRVLETEAMVTGWAGERTTGDHLTARASRRRGRRRRAGDRCARTSAACAADPR